MDRAGKLEKTKATITKAFIAVLFFIWPAMATLVLFLTTDIAGLFSNILKLFVSSACSGVIAYSFTAAFLLLTMPRNTYLKRLDKKGHTFSYALVLGTPSLFGMSTLVLFATDKFPVISNFLFMATVAHFVWSLSVLCLMTRHFRKD